MLPSLHALSRLDIHRELTDSLHSILNVCFWPQPWVKWMEENNKLTYLLHCIYTKPGGHRLPSLLCAYSPASQVCRGLRLPGRRREGQWEVGGDGMIYIIKYWQHSHKTLHCLAGSRNICTLLYIFVHWDAERGARTTTLRPAEQMLQIL